MRLAELRGAYRRRREEVSRPSWVPDPASLPPCSGRDAGGPCPKCGWAGGASARLSCNHGVEWLTRECTGCHRTWRERTLDAGPARF